MLTRLFLFAFVCLFTAAASAGPDDPYYSSKDSWGHGGDDQWALKRINWPENFDGANLEPVIVAVIDTGVDYYHPDFDPNTIWRNRKETFNGRDDDKNGFVDDLVGWNFIDGNYNPWDKAGHGTHVAGVIAAATNNGIGIAGMNPAAQIMSLKALNFLGGGHSTEVAQAIYYAVDNGAKVINLSLGAEHVSKVQQRAVNYAAENDVLVIAAAGNTGIEVKEFGPAGLENVLTVGASDFDDDKAGFSNWGQKIDVVAPGIDVLSLRARRTDIALSAGTEDYKVGDNFVGDPARYYRVAGTSFSTPFVSGLASMIRAQRPELSAEDVRRMIVYSARDVSTPGVDNYTGHGIIDVAAALKADPEFFIDAGISGVSIVQEGGGQFVQVQGIANADRLDSAWIEIGKGEDPSSFKRVTDRLSKAVQGGAVGNIPVGELRDATQWTLRLVVKHANGRQQEARFQLNLG